MQKYRVWVLWGSCVFLLVLSFALDMGFKGYGYLVDCPRYRAPDINPDPKVERSLKKHVAALAALGPRHSSNKSSLERSEQYVSRSWKTSGFETSGLNQSVLHDKKSAKASNRVILVTANYDSSSTSPGANANASGTAVLLEIAKWLKNKSVGKTIRFLAYSKESPAAYDLSAVIQPSEKLDFIMELNSMGYIRKDAKQSYISKLGNLFPSQGNFLAFIGDMRSRGLVNTVASGFSKHTDVPSRCVKVGKRLPAPLNLEPSVFDSNQHLLVQVTDTAKLRDTLTGTSEDVPERLDYRRLAKAVDALGNVLVENSFIY